MAMNTKYINVNCMPMATIERERREEKNGKTTWDRDQNIIN